LLRPKINDRNVMRPACQHPNPDHWAEVRTAALHRDGQACRCCPNDIASGVSLQIHHRHYGNWGQEAIEDLVTLCVLCHDAITSRIRETTEYNIVPPERMVRPDRPTVTTRTVTVQGTPERRDRPELPRGRPASVGVGPVLPTVPPPRDKPQR